MSCGSYWQQGVKGAQRDCAAMCSPHITGCSAEGITQLDLRALLHWGCGSRVILPCCGGACSWTVGASRTQR